MLKIVALRRPSPLSVSVSPPTWMCSGKETPSHSRSAALAVPAMPRERRRAAEAKMMGARMLEDPPGTASSSRAAPVKPSTASPGRRRRSRSPILATARAGLVDHDAAQRRQAGRQALPEPHRELLAGRILEAGDLVEIAVVERLMERSEGGRELGEIAHPAQARVERTRDVHRQQKGVSVQARAFVAGRNVGQAVCRLDAEFLEDLHRRQFT